MKNKIAVIFCVVVACSYSFSQSTGQTLVIEPYSYGVVLDDTRMKAVVVKKDIAYLADEKGKLHIDIYSPPNLKVTEKKPAIIFLNAMGDDPGGRKLKSWAIYTSWPTLMAAQGYIGISMECDRQRIRESLEALFRFLEAEGSSYGIDTDRLGVYAASANVSRSSDYLMSSGVSKGIKAAALYYGRPPVGPFRKDLPVLFVIAEGDMNRGYNSLWSEVLKNNAPWTIKMGTGMPHAFDANTDNDEARILIKETISFWKNHLDPIAAPSWKYSIGRDIMGSLQMNRPKALSLLKAATEENPDDIAALVFYANQLKDEKRLDEATVIYNKVLEKEPNNVPVLTSLAVLSYSQNKDKEGEIYIARAMKTGAMKRNDYANLGFYLLAANKNKEAVYYYEKAIAISPDSFDSYYLAKAYAKLNDTENAIRALGYAVKNGYGSKQQIENDSSFDLIRSDEKFKELLSTVK